MNRNPRKQALQGAVLAAFLSLGGSFMLAGPLDTLTLSEAPPNEGASVKRLNESLSIAERIAQGRQFFAFSCAECHGEDAHGDEGPDLHHLSLSSSQIKNTIRNGIKNEMPSFRKKYDDEQVDDLLEYVGSLK